MIHYTTTTWS